MKALLPFVITGVVTGSLYGLAGVGLVLTYRTSGIFNFGHGAVAAAAAYAFNALHVTHGLPWPLAALLTVGALGPVIGVLMARLAGALSGAAVSTKIVATIGLMLAVQGGLYLIFGIETRDFPVFLPGGRVEISGVFVSYAQLISIGAATAAVIGLFVLMRRTRLGVAMRGVVASPELLSLTGSSPARVRTAAWVIGSSFAALSGVLLAPTLGLDAGLLTFLVVQAFGAVALGRFKSLPLTYLGGIIVGVLASVTTRYVGGNPPWNGLPVAMPFLVLIAVLLVTPARNLPQEPPRTAVGRERPKRQVTGWLRLAPPAAGFTALAVVPFVVGTRISVYQAGLINALVLLALSVLVRTSGQINLAHAAFVAVGATTFSHLLTSGTPWFLALLGAGLVTVPLGALLAIPAIRLSGLYLALTTMGFAILMQNVTYNSFLMFGNAPYVSAGRPNLGFIDAGNERVFYFLVLALVAATCGAIVLVDRTRLGRLLNGLSDSPVALTVHGLSVNITRVIIFCLSAFLAGCAGALVVAQAGSVSRDVSFSPFRSLLLLAVLTMSGRSLVLPAFLAAFLLTVAPSYLTSISLEWQLVMFGGAAVFAAVGYEQGPRWNARFRVWAANAADRGRGRLSPLRDGRVPDSVTAGARP